MYAVGYNIVAAYFLGSGRLSVIWTPTTFGSKDSSPSDLFAKLCSKNVRPSLLKLQNAMANEL